MAVFNEYITLVYRRVELLNATTNICKFQQLRHFSILLRQLQQIQQLQQLEQLQQFRHFSSTSSTSATLAVSFFERILVPFARRTPVSLEVEKRENNIPKDAHARFEPGTFEFMRQSSVSPSPPATRLRNREASPYFLNRK